MSKIYITVNPLISAAARGKNVSGDPAHQHQYITVGVNTPSSTYRVELHSLGLGVSFSSPVVLVSVELHS